MGLRSKEWFYGQCYQQVRGVTRLAFLANKALELGFRKEKTGGHILQACGGVQAFLDKYPRYKKAVRGSSPTEPFRLQGKMLRSWVAFFSSKSGVHRQRFNYNWESLRTYLTRKYGGKCRGGGGGDNEFEIVLRLMAELK